MRFHENKWRLIYKTHKDQIESQNVVELLGIDITTTLILKIISRKSRIEYLHTRSSKRRPIMNAFITEQ